MTQSSAPASVRGERVYLIRKSGAWYRPDSAGYTNNANEAGLYTLEEAEEITHPNGPDGPRDAMSYHHRDTVPALARSSANGEAEGVRGYEAGVRAAAALFERDPTDEAKTQLEVLCDEGRRRSILSLLSSPRPEPVKVGEVMEQTIADAQAERFMQTIEKSSGTDFAASGVTLPNPEVWLSYARAVVPLVAPSIPTEGDARRVEALERLTELYESEYDADASFVRPQWLQEALSSSRPEPTPDADEALSLAQALRAADYDTHKLFDLLVEAADLIEGQHRALAATHAAIARELLEALKDLADRYEGNLYSNMAARKARAIIAKAEGRS